VVSSRPTEIVCHACGEAVLLDPLGWLYYWEEHDPSRSIGGQVEQCDACGELVFAFVGDLSLAQTAAAYFSGVTH